MSLPRAGQLASVLLAALAAAGLAGGGLTGCARPPAPRSAAAQRVVIPSVSSRSFTTGFSMMRRLRALSRLGTGKIGVLLPDTTTSPRYTEFDAPYLARALQEAGLSRSQFIITNAQGSDATEQAQAESDMTQGATVLLLDPIDSGVGASIESAAASLGVKVIDYDRMTLGGTRAY
jgi:D-xylose transport system substrate-binding protein